MKLTKDARSYNTLEPFGGDDSELLFPAGTVLTIGHLLVLEQNSTEFIETDAGRFSVDSLHLTLCGKPLEAM